MSQVLPGGGDNFTCDGKVAPPSPTIPAAPIRSMISSGEAVIFLFISGDLSIVSSHTSPSVLIIIADRL